MTATFALKLFLVPSLIYLVTLAGRRWGPAVAGWMSAFPVVAGPILLAIALDHGTAFAATAAAGTLLAVIATLVFCVVYAWCSGRWGVGGTLAAAFSAYALAVAGLNQTSLSTGSEFAAVLGSLVLASRLFPQMHAPSATDGSPGDLVGWRMASGAGLVLLVTAGAASLGPKLSGILAMFPVMGSVLTGFTHARQGRAHAVALLRGMTLGYVAFAVFCLVVAQLLATRSIGFAFATAFLAALLVQVGLKALVAARPQAAARTPQP